MIDPFQVTQYLTKVLKPMQVVLKHCHTRSSALNPFGTGVHGNSAEVSVNFALFGHLYAYKSMQLHGKISPGLEKSSCHSVFLTGYQSRNCQGEAHRKPAWHPRTDFIFSLSMGL